MRQHVRHDQGHAERSPRGPRPPFCVRRARERAAPAGQFTESSGEIKFPEISTPILEKVIQYFYYKLRYTNSQARGGVFSRRFRPRDARRAPQVRIPEFNIEPEMALELLMASNFLDC